jgi:hypothetical protein
MKPFFCVIACCCCLSIVAQPTKKTRNIIIITIDGFRWQELFTGADKTILNNPKYVADTTLAKEMYWDDDTLARRKMLMPFFWNVLAKKGQIYGNRSLGNCMNVTNRYKFSYPGYNEIFTGYADARFIPNSPVLNKNTNVFEYLNKQDAYKGSVVAFSSWNIFPFILNEERSKFEVNSGYENLNESDSVPSSDLIDRVQDSIIDKGHTRYDDLTFVNAKEYIKNKHPKVALIGLGESDEFAHHGKYDAYLRSAADVDRMIAELWYYVQTDSFYKDNTTFIITTDHGRGRKTRTWSKHLFFVGGSREVWMAMIGPDILPMGEMKAQETIYQNQIAATIAHLLGEEFISEHKIGQALTLPSVNNNDYKMFAAATK